MFDKILSQKWCDSSWRKLYIDLNTSIIHRIARAIGLLPTILSQLKKPSCFLWVVGFVKLAFCDTLWFYFSTVFGI